MGDTGPGFTVDSALIYDLRHYAHEYKNHAIGRRIKTACVELERAWEAERQAATLLRSQAEELEAMRGALGSVVRCGNCATCTATGINRR